MRNTLLMLALAFPLSSALASSNLDAIIGSYSLKQGQEESIGCESKLVFSRANDSHTLNQYVENLRGFKATYQMQNINLGPKVLGGREPGTIIGKYKSISSTTFNAKKNVLTYEQRNINSRLGINTSDHLYIVTYQFHEDTLKVTHLRSDDQVTLDVTNSCIYIKE